MTETVALPTRPELADFVHRTLCRLDALDPIQTRLSQSPITRRGRRAGTLFTVAGPRRVRASAVWAAHECKLLFYDSAGGRVRTFLLSESPER